MSADNQQERRVYSEEQVRKISEAYADLVLNTHLLETGLLENQNLVNASIYGAEYGLQRLEESAPNSLRQSLTVKRINLEKALNSILESSETTL